jgi:hypothetical protein
MSPAQHRFGSIAKRKYMGPTAKPARRTSSGALAASLQPVARLRFRHCLPPPRILHPAPTRETPGTPTARPNTPPPPPVRLSYQPPTSSTFLSEQTSHQQPASITFLSEQIRTSHQPSAKQTGYASALRQGEATIFLSSSYLDP